MSATTSFTWAKDRRRSLRASVWALCVLLGTLASLPVQAALIDVTSVTLGTPTNLSDQTVNGITYSRESVGITLGQTAIGAFGPANLATNLVIRRSGVGPDAGNQVIWSERPASTPATTVRTTVPTTAQAVLNQNNFFQGTDNTFVNTGNGSGNQSDIERLDFINTTGFKVNSGLAALIMERGTSNSHDPFQIALITSLDSNGNPNGYTNLVIVNPGWGASNLRVVGQNPGPNPSPNPTQTVLNDFGNGVGQYTNTASISGQNYGGVLVTLDHWAINFGQAPVGSTIYGYSLFATDVTTGGNNNNLVNWLNSTYYPTNTQEGVTQGGGGIDLVSTNFGIVNIPEPGSMALLGLCAAGYLVRRYRNRSRTAFNS